jgi:alpha-galactosidase
MDEEDFKWAKKITDEYRSIRNYFSMDFYNHGSSCFDPTAWAIWQYHDVQTQSGIVMAFRRTESPFDQVKIDLKGLLPDKQYTFTNIDTHSSHDEKNSIVIRLPEKRSSVILKYQLRDQ